MESCDVLVVGGGPGGLGAAVGAKRNGAQKVIVVERDVIAGGILNQCIHDGFGLIRYGTALSGPEYADRTVQEVLEIGAELWTGCQVSHLTAERSVTVVGCEGMRHVRAGAVVLATGCRERTRGMISIPGTRPAGVFTAGVVQNLINIRDIMVGKRVVILGSGDVGLIMARRLTLEGAQVLAVAEIRPQPEGLARNVSQCLNDFGIPLYVKHTVSEIIGGKRLEAVRLAQVDDQGEPIPGTDWLIECDTLVLSIGLIPENEIAAEIGITFDPQTNGVITDDFLQTSIPGIFSCGNSRQVMDLADYVSEQGERAGENAMLFLQGRPLIRWEMRRHAGMVKGTPKEHCVTCPLCPNGCQVQWDETAEVYQGNQCPRGAVFADQERTAPVRTLTSTLKVTGGVRPSVSVRSEPGVRKDELRAACMELKKQCVTAPIDIGQVLYTYTGKRGEQIRMIATSAVAMVNVRI